MKYSCFKIILSIFFLSTFSHVFQSCSERDVEPVPTAGLILIGEGYAAAAKLELYSHEPLFAGYNPVYIALYDSVSGKRIRDSHISLHPLMHMQTMTHSCPVENPASEAVNELFPASILFTMPSGDMGNWTIEANVNNYPSSTSGKTLMQIDVLPGSPSRLISFQAENGQRYYLGYYFQDKMKVGPNAFEVIAFTRQGDGYVPAENLSVNLNPEMPSMDHGSPNNQNPTHIGGGHYSGVVNFTMTGEWRLNLALSTPDAALGTKYFDVIVE